MTIPNEITNSEAIIDSRDVIARIEWLEDTEDPEEQEELKALVALAKEGDDYAADWIHGEALIRATYFTEYAQDLAEDIGSVPQDPQWPNHHIDWEAAANELKIDYTEVDFDGVAYYIR